MSVVRSPSSLSHFRDSSDWRAWVLFRVPSELARETTPLSVQLALARERRIEVELPFDDDALRYALVVVRTAAGEIVLKQSLGTEGGETITVRCGFASGDYRKNHTIDLG